MKVRLKKLVGMLLIGVLTISLISGCSTKKDSDKDSSVKTEDGSSEATQSPEETYKIVMAWPGGDPGEGASLVQEELNKYLKEKINVEVEFLPISGSAAQQINLMLSANEKLDLLITDSAGGNSFVSYVAQNKYLALDDYLAENGQGILDTLGDYLNATKVDGKIYAIPTLRDMASGYGALVSKAALDACNVDFDVNNVTTYEDFEKVLAALKKSNPDKPVLATPGPVVSIWSVLCNSYDPLGDYIGALANRGQDNLTVVNMFEDETYIEELKMLRSWYEKGYIVPDITTNADVFTLAIMGELPIIALAQKPGIESAMSAFWTAGTYAYTLGNTMQTTQNVSNVIMGIPVGCERPDKVVQFLELMYTDPVVVNLVDYGVEGTHYVKTDLPNVIAYPDGVDATTSTYTNINGAYFGNQLLGYTMNTVNADVWEQTKTFNQNAVPSKAFGFVFDPANVKNEYTAVQNVLEQYRIPLEDGSVDVEDILPKFQKALKTAGIDTIIAEKQRQLDEWAATNGIN